MRLITKMTIEGFRSVRLAEIEGLSGLTVLAGLNNSGKSNVLRALNAFFNDQTDPGRWIDVDDDYHRPDLRKKKRKRIRVTLDFDLPDQFRFRKGLEPVQQLLGGQTFSIAKEWTRDDPLPKFFLNETELALDDQQKLRQFLSLIKFRYVPNRVAPTEVIRNEHQSLRDVLVRRLTQRASQDQDAFKAIRSTSERMISSLAKRFSEALPGEGTVTLATPTSWQELAFAFGYKLGRDGVEIEDVAQGSGIQSLLMLETLYLVDRDYFQQFGWRQAAIWGLEEPESSLHYSLEAQIAAYLASIASEPSSRLQVICTTHSDTMVQYADRTILVEHGSGQSLFEVTADARYALEKLSDSGTSRWVHPLLHFPLDPVILCEGEFDRVFLEEALRVISPKHRARIADLPTLDRDAPSGGLEKLKAYVKGNAGAIRARRQEAPVVVVLDWDAASKCEEFSRLVKNPDRFKVFAWPGSALNPQLGKSFRGVERGYSTRVIDQAISQGVHVGRTGSGDYFVSGDSYGQIKATLAEIIRGGLDANDVLHCKPFLEDVLQAAGADR